MIDTTLVSFTTRRSRAEEIAAEIATSPYFSVAEDGAGIVGFASYGAFRAGPGYAHTIEHSVHVAEAARARGIGSQLMEALEAQAAGAGIHVIVAGVSSANPRSIAFHARRGFQEVGRLPEVGRKWDQWLDLVLMQKILYGVPPLT